VWGVWWRQKDESFGNQNEQPPHYLDREDKRRAVVPLNIPIYGPSYHPNKTTYPLPHQSNGKSKSTSQTTSPKATINESHDPVKGPGCLPSSFTLVSQKPHLPHPPSPPPQAMHENPSPTTTNEHHHNHHAPAPVAIAMLAVSIPSFFPMRPCAFLLVTSCRRGRRSCRGGPWFWCVARARAHPNSGEYHGGNGSS